MTFFQAPGRMNIFDEHPFKVILDYAHNPAAVKAMFNLVSQMEVEARRIVVLAAPGDRRDQDIEKIGTLAAGHFDYYLCKADDHRRGRGEDEVPKMIRKALLDNGVDDKIIKVIPDEQTCIHHTLNMAQPGDLVLILGDEITRCWKQITKYNSDGAEKPTIKKQKGAVPPQVEDFILDKSIDIVRDERGVRLAREKGD